MVRILMGPHASQLNVEERWKVIRYVQTLQGNDAPAEGSAAEGAVREESTIRRGSSRGCCN